MTTTDTAPDSLTTCFICVVLILSSCIFYFFYLNYLQEWLDAREGTGGFAFWDKQPVANPILVSDDDAILLQDGINSTHLDKESVGVAADSAAKMHPPIPNSIYLLVGGSLLTNFLFAGIIFGWPLLQLLFEDEGIMRPASCGDKGSMCYEQLSQIMLVYTIAATAQACFTLPGGYMVDILGPRKCISVAMILMTLGLLLFAFSDKQSFYGFLFASILVSCGGGLSFTTSFLCGFLLDKQYLNAYFAAANCMFDGSTMMFFIVYQIYNAGVSRKVIFICYSIISVFVYLCVLYYWCIHESDVNTVKSIIAKSNDDLVATDEKCDEGDVEIKAIRDVDKCSGVNFSSSSYSSDNNKNSNSNGNNKSNNNRNDKSSGGGDFSDSNSKMSDASVDKSFADTVGMAFKRLKWHEQIKSKQFIFLASFISINLLRSNVYMGTAANMLQNMGGKSAGNVYAQVFSAILPCGFVFIPFIDATLKKLGFIKTFDCVTLSAGLYIILSLIPSMPLQVLTFIVFCAYRSYFYSVTGAFTAHTFGPVNVGRVYGIAFLLAGIVNFVAWPAQVVTVKYAHGDYTGLSVFLLILSIPQYLVTRFVLSPMFQRKEIEDVVS